MANELLENKTFELHYQKKGFGKFYNFEINQIHFNHVDGFDVKEFGFKEGTDTLLLKIGGVNIDATLEGKASALWLIAGHFESFTITNLTMRLEVSIDAAKDQVKYKVVEDTDFHIQDFNIKMKESIWNMMLIKSHDYLLTTINLVLNRFVPNRIQRKVVAYNNKIAHGGPMTFVNYAIGHMVHMGNNLPLNLTMTKAPEFRSSDQMIELHMDGRFINPTTN